MKRRKRVTSALLALILVLQCVGMLGIVQEVKAESPALPSPVLDVSFDSLQQTAGTALTGSFEAETGQEVKVHDKVTVTEGKDSGKAVLLDNKSGQTGYLTTPNTDKLNPQNLSVSMWIKRTGTTNNTEGRILWAKETNATDANPWMSDGWFLGWTGGESMAYVTNGKNMAVQKGNSDDLLDVNEWIHLAATFDSTTGSHVLYKNGQPFATSTTAGASISRNADAVDLMIGKSGYGNAGLGCVVDSIQIYDQALSARQVGQLAGTTEEEFFQSDYDALSVPARVSQDFQILTKGAGGTDISWKSDNRAITFDGNTAKVTRASGDVTVKLAATLTLGELKKTKEFSVLIAGTDAASSALKHLDWDEIVDVGGVIGTRLKESMNNYAYEYLYKTRMQGYLNEYKNHSHSSWSWLEGEQPGKWLETMSLSKWMNDSRYDAAIKDVADQLAKYQLEANPNATDYSRVGGYLGNGTSAIRANKPVKGMDPYEMYSTLNGLMETYENYAKNDPELSAEALDMAVKLADYLTATIGDETTDVEGVPGLKKAEFWPLANVNGTTIAGHDVHEGWEGTLLIDPMMRLSEIMKEKDNGKSDKYSEWSQWCIDNIDKWSPHTPYADLEKVYSGEMGIHEIQGYVHAHTFQMNFLGFMKKYRETGDVSYLNKVEGAWKDITNRQRYITGTVSVGEHYEAGHNLPNTGSVCETCATNSWTLLTDDLFRQTKEATYQQTVEDIIFNHMFATSTIDGDGYSYHRPLNGTTDRFYTGPDCCSASGMRMQAYLPYYIYSKSDQDVYINQFITSEAKIRLDDDKIFHISQTTEYPTEDTIHIEVGADTTSKGNVYIRIPEWVKNPSVKVNGKAVEGLTADEYVCLNGLKAGDKIVVTFPSELTWVEGTESNEGLWTMKKGPMVYCEASAFMTKEQSQESFGQDVASVSSSSVIKPEDAKAVKTEGVVTFDEDSILGNGYQVKMNTVKGEQNVLVVPYANIGQWYRYGEAKPADYGSAQRYPYVTWMSGTMTDYPERPEPEEKPVVHYNFDDVDGTTVKDISGNHKDAQLKGNAAIQENGRLGKSVYLNGANDSHVKLPNDVIYGLYDMTISTWIKPDDYGRWARVFDFGNEADPPYPNLFLTLNSGNNVTRLAFEADGGKTNIDGSKSFAINSWQHAAIVINGTTAYVYLNGEKIGENTSFNYFPYSSEKMISNLLGKSNYTNDALFKGSLDDFRIYNRPLSVNEITALSKGEEPVKEITAIKPLDDVQTIAGTAPKLPKTVEVTYSDGTYGSVSVAWDSIPAEKYESAGTFEVKGTVEGTALKASVTVKVAKNEITVIKALKDVETIAGTAPVLPKKAEVTYADKTTGSVDVTWDKIPEEKYQSAGTFEVKGTVKDTDLKATVTVKVLKNEITAIKPLADVETVVGTAPELPKKVEVTYTDKTTGTVDVTWDKIPEEKYQDAGTFEVKGTVKDTDLKATVTVKVIKEEVKLPFIDVNEDDWFTPYVQFVFENEIMTGLSETEFGVNVALSRAHFATILYRMEGSPEVEYTELFPDVTKDMFYTEPALWANKEGIIKGYENKNFGPDDNITREQLATMLYRYAEYKKLNTSVKGDLTIFPDDEKVSGFAKEAVEWAVAAGIISGEGDSKELNPQGETSRAVCATIIQRFMKE